MIYGVRHMLLYSTLVFAVAVALKMNSLCLGFTMPSMIHGVRHMLMYSTLVFAVDVALKINFTLSWLHDVLSDPWR